MNQITRKNTLASTLKKLQKEEEDEYEFIPRTWVLPNESHELTEFAAKMKQKRYD